MAAETSLSPELIRQLLDYDPRTGLFVWRRRVEQAGADKAFNRRFSGKPALYNVGANGYPAGSIKCVSVYAHRVAWAWMTGKWPDGEIDHIDGNRTNNAFSNLRLASRQDNAMNLGARKAKRSALPKGVFIGNRKSPNPFRAQIVVGKRAIHLGVFRSPDEASAAYREAASKYGFSDRHVAA